jgi:hypothetical protein
VVHLLYAMALVSAGAAACGIIGVLLSASGLALWTSYHWRFPHRITRLDVGVGMSAMTLLAIVFEPVEGPAPFTRTDSCGGNLTQITQALQNYHDAYGSFPPAFVADESGRPMHSWRLLILPYLEEQALYDAYRFDQPWDGPDNIKLESRIPSTYRCPVQRARNPAHSDFKTGYFAVVGPQTAWPGQTAGRLAAITDGPECTLLLVEDTNRLSWLAPHDIAFDEALRRFSSEDSTGPHRDGGHFAELEPCRTAVLVNGVRCLLRDGLPVQTWRDLLTAGNGSSVSEQAIIEVGNRSWRVKWGAVCGLSLFLVLLTLPGLRTLPFCQKSARIAAQVG